jgi:AcrR family transcriptional regulator
MRAAATASFEVLSATMDATPDDEAQQPKRRTGEHAARIGGRSERVVRDVLTATAAELSRCGYAALRMEDVATAAGVNKTTVYRRWPTKLELVRATLSSLSHASSTAPDLGSIRADLRNMIDGVVARMENPEKRCIARMIFAEMDQPEVQELVHAMRAEHLIPWQTVISRGIARGELPAGSDAPLIVDVLLGTVMGGVLRFQANKDPGYLQAVVDLVVAGAKGGGAVREGAIQGRAPADTNQ